MDLGLNLENTHVLITGGTGFIGSATVTALLSAGARVTSLDLRSPDPSPQTPNFQFFSCDISSEADLTHACSRQKSLGQLHVALHLHHSTSPFCRIMRALSI